MRSNRVLSSDKERSPKVTLGIVSCNRLHYLKALIESALYCIEYDNLEWIIVDNASVESGLNEYVEGLSFVQRKMFRSDRNPASEFAEGLNYIIEESSAEYVLLLSDDIQFIVKGAWMHDLVECAQTFSNLGTVDIDALRRQTCGRYFSTRSNLWDKWLRPKKWNRYRVSSGTEFLGYGEQKDGVAGAGILTFARKATWQRLGPWEANSSQTVGDSTAGAEDEMLTRYRHSGMQLERFVMRMPVAATLITDERGTMARIRGNRRYGSYWGPPRDKFYYDIVGQGDLENYPYGSGPIAFEDIVNPRGFDLPLDEFGNVLKNPYLDSEAPFEWIHPSVQGIDI